MNVAYLVLGLVGLVRINRSGGRLPGRRLAIAGFRPGWLVAKTGFASWGWS